MATFITVTQEGSELLRRNQEQAQAARLAKLEGDEQARTEKEAKRQRQAELQRRGLDASGNALGDSRRRQPFRRDEPAASLVASRVLLVTWNGIQPVLSDRSAVRLSGQPHPNASSTIITASATVPALGMSGASSNSYWEYRTSQSAIKGASDFTFEAWVQFVSSPLSMAIIQVRDSNMFAMEMRYFYTDGTLDLGSGVYFSITDPVDGFVQSLGGGTSIPLSQPQHICMMRKDGSFYWAINGFMFTTNTTSAAQALTLTGNTQIDLGLYASGNQSPNKLGPLRLDPDKARYDINGFTPDPLPFRP